MVLIKCPDCGKMFSEHAEICPECGCPKEIVKKEQKYICSECNTIIEGEEEACPNCGCPKDGFQILEEPIFADEERNITNEEHTSSRGLSFMYISLILIAVSLGFVGIKMRTSSLSNDNYSNNFVDSENEYRVEQERLEQEKREEEEAKKRFEKRQKELLKELAGTWQSGFFEVNSEVGSARYVMNFSESKQLSISIIETFTGRVLARESGSFNIIPASEDEKSDNVGDIIINTRYGAKGIEMHKSMFSMTLTFNEYELRKISR